LPVSAKQGKKISLREAFFSSKGFVSLASPKKDWVWVSKPTARRGTFLTGLKKPYTLGAYAAPNPALSFRYSAKRKQKRRPQLKLC